MLVKVVLLFLLAMVLVAMVGRALFPGALRRGPSRLPPAKPATCPRCGSFLIGAGPCTCGGPKRKV
jgi:hypothetical protein